MPEVVVDPVDEQDGNIPLAPGLGSVQRALDREGVERDVGATDLRGGRALEGHAWKEEKRNRPWALLYHRRRP